MTTVGEKQQFRYANSHSGIGAFGMAFNYPKWNTASIVTSGSARSESKKEFKPLVVQTYTNDGKVGIGTEKPASRLAIAAPERQFSVNDWVDISSQGSIGFIGMNAHVMMKGTQQEFVFSNTGENMGAVGVATNFPGKNQLSIVASKSSDKSKQGTAFKPLVVATYTNSGMVGVGVTEPSARLDVRHSAGRQISANKYADVSANDMSQAFFGGNGYTVGGQYAYSNTHPSIGAVGLATHYPSANSASIIASGSSGGKAGSSFEPKVLAQFKPDGTLEVTKDVIVKGDLHISGRLIYDESTDASSQYDMLAAHEALVSENMKLRQRLDRMEQTLAAMSK